MKKKVKDIKHKLKMSSLVAVASASILTGGTDDVDGVVNQEYETPHEACISQNNFKQKAVSSIAYIIKSILMIPLWFAGSIFLKLLEPLKNFAISFLITFVILCLIVVIIAKLLFPKLKIKDILSLKNILIIAVFSLLINICRIVLPLINKDLLKYTLLIYFVFGLCCLIIILLPLIRLSKQINSLYKAIPKVY